MKTTTIASDFVDGTDLSEEYTYDGNGRLTMDTNRGIASISYDLCNNPQAIAFTGTNGIQYIYASDGTRLRTVHKVSGFGGSVTRDTTDYLGNLVMSDSYIISTDENDTDSEGKTPDERAKEAAILEINTDYDVVTANCSHVVTRALSAAGKPNGYVADDTGENAIPKYLFVNIVIQNERLNTLIDLWERIKRSLSN